MKKISIIITFFLGILFFFFLAGYFPQLDIIDKNLKDSLMFFSYKYHGGDISVYKKLPVDPDKIFVIELDDDSYKSINEKYNEFENLSAQKRLAFTETLEFLIPHKPKIIMFDFTFEYNSYDDIDKKFLAAMHKAEKNGISVIVGSKLSFTDNFGKQEVIHNKPVFDITTGVLNQVFSGKLIREPVLLIKNNDEYIDSLAFSGFKKFIGNEKFEIIDNTLIAGDYKIPLITEKVNDNYILYKYNLFYRLSWEGIAAFPLSAFIDKKIMEDYKESFYRSEMINGELGKVSAFKNSIILAGTSSADDQDLVYYPFSDFGEGVVPGVHVHVNSVFGLINRSYFNDMSKKLFNFIIIILIILSMTLFYRSNALNGIIIFVFIIFVYLILNSMLFMKYSINTPVSISLLSLAFSFLIVQTHRFIFETKEKKQIRGAFSKYISPDLVNKIVDKPELLKLGGEEKELTILFSDVANFTTLSEKIGAVNLVKFLNEYLTAMTDIVMETSGTLDKYIGDAVMAFWGAPLDDEEHSQKACNAAILMMKKLNELKIEWKKKGYPDLNIRIGLNTGVVVVGNMGSFKRFNYTVMGDAVNLAARLEGLNKEYSTGIMVSEFTYEQNKDKFNFRFLDLVKVKGKTLPVAVYELLQNDVDEEFKKGLEVFNNAFEHYKKGEFRQAKELFLKVNDFIKDDSVSATFIKRCDMLVDSVPDEWNGVWKMTTK
ncbi:MAG: CHASE2 domain-containing protein [Candidatus Muirbacterium halophilum]|nr:CHASE2 domain-containing protein [Candidatus Muirbacterium halophilum]MCK9476644.1 CHASE2 domain-containing protein [Candidatus Muirbacterium halophilum]